MKIFIYETQWSYFVCDLLAKKDKTQTKLKINLTYSITYFVIILVIINYFGLGNHVVKI